MDEATAMGSGFSDLSSTVIVGILVVVLGVVFAYLLAELTRRRRRTVSRRRENATTANALLEEFSQIAQLLRRNFPEYIASTDYWHAFPRIPKAMYQELDGQGRVIQLGVAVATDVHAIYTDVDEINRLLPTVEQTISDHPEISRSVDFLNANLGDMWHDIWLCRSRIERRFGILRPTFEALGSFSHEP